MNESIEQVLRDLAARVQKLEEALCADSDAPRGQFAHLGGIERHAGIAPNPTAAPVDFSRVGGKCVRKAG